MGEVFQNYTHYLEWMRKNFYSESILDDLIIKRGLVIERNNSCNGEPYRYLNKKEFLEMEEKDFVLIPFV